MKKSLGNRLDAAEEEILLVLDARYSVSRVCCLFSFSLGLNFGAVGLRLLSNFWSNVGEAFLNICSSLGRLLVTRIGISACIN